MTPEQKEQVADNLLAKPRQERDARRARREAAGLAARRRRESPIVPALTSAIAVVIAVEYGLGSLASVVLGTAVGGLFGWAARRS